MTLVRRAGGPPLRFQGRPLLAIDWGAVGPWPLGIRLWEMRSGGFVVAHPVLENGAVATVALSARGSEALLARVEEAARRPAAPHLPPDAAPTDPVDGLRTIALQAAWTAAFRDLVGVALDRLEGTLDRTEAAR